MKIIYGKSVCKGIAIGKIRAYKKEKKRVGSWKIIDIDQEIKRFDEAKEKASCQLKELYKKAVEEAGESSAKIFEAHQMMLHDEYYVNAVKEMIRTEHINTEYAVSKVCEELNEVFTSMEDYYISERAADIKDVSERILSILAGEISRKDREGEPVIIVADDLTPS